MTRAPLASPGQGGELDVVAGTHTLNHGRQIDAAAVTTLSNIDIKLVLKWYQDMTNL